MNILSLSVAHIGMIAFAGFLVWMARDEREFFWPCVFFLILAILNPWNY